MGRKNRNRAARPAVRYPDLVPDHEGDVHFSGGLHVDGKIRGRVIAEEGSDAVVRVSEVGEITGDVIARIIINGGVSDVRSSAHLELAEKASITGNVYANWSKWPWGLR